MLDRRSLHATWWSVAAVALNTVTAFQWLVYMYMIIGIKPICSMIHPMVPYLYQLDVELHVGLGRHLLAPPHVAHTLRIPDNTTHTRTPQHGMAQQIRCGLRLTYSSDDLTSTYLPTLMRASEEQ